MKCDQIVVFGFIVRTQSSVDVTEFAEQIVFGKTLENILIVAGKSTHDGTVPNRPDVRSLVWPARCGV